MKPANLFLALQIIAEKQAQTAPVTLRIGTVVDGVVEHSELRILNCPASIIEALQAAQFTVSMEDGDLAVADYSVKEVL